VRIIAGVLVALAVLVPLAATAVRRRSEDRQDVAAPAGRTLANGLLALAVFVLVVLVVVALRR
jgi:hypothetical protein